MARVIQKLAPVTAKMAGLAQYVPTDVRLDSGVSTALSLVIATMELPVIISTEHANVNRDLQATE